ncbi:MAG TPA: hypothetical protein VNE86_02130 [Nitrososphaerales archaeon]|nr:hypothetical protein [Nitrososphaerales archaeon]
MIGRLHNNIVNETKVISRFDGIFTLLRLEDVQSNLTTEVYKGISESKLIEEKMSGAMVYQISLEYEKSIRETIPILLLNGRKGRTTISNLPDMEVGYILTNNANMIKKFVEKKTEQRPKLGFIHMRLDYRKKRMQPA